MQAFFDNLVRELDKVEFLRPPEKRDTMLVNLRNIFPRMEPTKQDMHTLHGVVMAIAEGRKGPAKGGVLDGEQATRLRALLAEHGQGGVPSESGTVRGLARLLRRNPTDAERLLWQALTRDRRFAGQFKRQTPVGRHIPDFVSFVHRIAIELVNPDETETIAADRAVRQPGWRRAAIGWSTCMSATSSATLPKNSTGLNPLSTSVAKASDCLKLRQLCYFVGSLQTFPTARVRWQAAFLRPDRSRTKCLRLSANTLRHGTAIALFGGVDTPPTGEQLMSTFDNPFDPERSLRSNGCGCGRHASEAEHEAAAHLQIKASLESEQNRYEGVVASAVMRAMFPQDAARRAFLKSVGASTALAALSQFFPLGTATEAFAQGGPLEKKDLKVGFIPITCATPIIMAHPMGFYAKHGLNVEVVKTAGWAVIRDKTHQQGIRRRAHALADAARHHARRRLQPDPLHDAGGREHQRPGDHARHQAQGQARSEGLEGLQVRRAVRLLDAQLSAALLSRRARPRSRTPTSRSARCRRRKWSPICAPTTSTASSRPIR